MAWDDGGNDYYTKEQLAAFQIQVQQQQAKQAANEQAVRDTNFALQNNHAQNVMESPEYRAQYEARAREASERAQISDEVNRLNAAASGSALNPDGSPAQKRFKSISKDDGTLLDSYKIGAWQDVNANRSALDLLKKDGLREAGTDSAWAQLEKQKQTLKQQDSMDAGANQGANAYLAAQSNLAQTGGMSGNARERLARNNMRDTVSNSQGVRRQGLMDMLNISSTDETNRLSGLQNIQGMENSQSQFAIANQENAKKIEGTNLQNQLGELSAKRGYETNTYNKQMEMWAADKSAKAQAAAAGGGGKK